MVRCNTSALQLHSHTVKFTDKVLGLFDGLLKVQIAAPARDGLANEELLTFLSEVLSFSFSSLFLLSLFLAPLSLLSVSRLYLSPMHTFAHEHTAEHSNKHTAVPNKHTTTRTHSHLPQVPLPTTSETPYQAAPVFLPL